MPDEYDPDAKYFLENGRNRIVNGQDFTDVPSAATYDRTFINEDGEKQRLFSVNGDDYWKPRRYALEAQEYNQSHGNAINKYISNYATQNIYSSAKDIAKDTAAQIGEQA